MRTTIALDDDLLAKAQALTGIPEKAPDGALRQDGQKMLGR